MFSVSIVVPNYNHGRFLERRLESIFGQTFQDFEVIILDDCSTDNSREIIESYRNNPKVSAIVYNQFNSGSPFKQWNKGIHLAKGEYIWIAESDDFCEPCFLETLVAALRSSDNCALAFFSDSDIDGDGRLMSDWRKTGKNVLYKGSSFIIKELLLGNIVYNASCVVFKRAIALQLSNQWQNSRGAGDYWFWVLMAKKGDAYSLGHSLASRRIHDSNVTSGANSSGSNLKDERLIVNYIYDTCRIAVWRKILAENLRRRRVHAEKFDNEGIRAELLSIWTYGSKLGTLPELITKVYYKLRKFNILT